LRWCIIYKLYIEIYYKNGKKEDILKILEIEYPSKKHIIKINKLLEGVLNS
jgi:hypothetical protein